MLLRSDNVDLPDSMLVLPDTPEALTHLINLIKCLKTSKQAFIMLAQFKNKVLDYLKVQHHKNGLLQTDVPGLSVFVADSVGELRVEMYESAVCLVLQGSKETRYGTRAISLNPAEVAIVSYDVPVISQITSASKKEPYLAVILSLQYSLLKDLYRQISETELTTARHKLIATEAADSQLLATLYSLFCLCNNPLQQRILLDNLTRQAHFHVLTSLAGATLRQLQSDNSQVARVTRAIRYVYQHPLEPITIQALADEAGMSQSTFFKHFKDVTSMTPLDFQKNLRLSKAFSLLREGGMSVASTAYEVGYNSATQFSREFSRKFGCSPGSIKSGDLAASD